MVNRIVLYADASVPVWTLPVSDDQQLRDWDRYYQMLLAGRLTGFAGNFIVIHQGAVVAHGADSDELRTSAANQLGVAADRLVVPFVDRQECIVME